MRYFLKTLIDTGFSKIKSRIIFEIKKFIYKYISTNLLEAILFSHNKTPLIEDKLFKNLNIKNYPKQKKITNGTLIKLKFLNEEKNLSFPFDWNSKEHSQLWNFNLHYFDWVRYLLEDAINHKKWNRNSSYIIAIIDDWIEQNKLGKGDGWHPYTVSLRTRNWIWFFRCCPNLINNKRIESLWQQIIWLNHNLEFCYKGNHLIENITSLIICSIQFKGKRSKKLLNKGLIILKEELENQILKDGGHEERTASYHLLILDRLLEVVCILRIAKIAIPEWLNLKILMMNQWSKNILIGSEKFPRFNDSPNDGCGNIKDILSFADSYLNPTKISSKGFRFNLLNNTGKNFQNKIYKNNQLNFTKKSFCDLPDTGWTIIRPNQSWEFIFKCGRSCPDRLPAHGHSDLLSFDLFLDGEPIIAETGTSIYGGNKNIRQIERSSISHNVIQLGYFQCRKEKIHWIEPIEVWGNFRAARKAKITQRKYGKKNNSTFWVSGSHDGFKKIKANIVRTININLNSQDELIFSCLDKITCEKSFLWRQWWHLGPNVNKEIIRNTFDYKLNSEKINIKFIKTWYSKKFGERINRYSIFSMGKLKSGENIFVSKIKFPKNIIKN